MLKGIYKTAPKMKGDVKITFSLNAKKGLTENNNKDEKK